MPKREMGLMGYVGEAVICQWLWQKYPAEEGYKVVHQVKSLGVPATGGPYLDFGVARGTNLVALYEVNTYKLVIFFQSQRDYSGSAGMRKIN